MKATPTIAALGLFGMFCAGPAEAQSPGRGNGANKASAIAPRLPAHPNANYQFTPNRIIMFGTGSTIPEPPAKDGKAVVRVVVPTMETELFLDDVKTLAEGRERIFYTPILEAGYRYKYSFTAKWTKDGNDMRETRTVDVFPGRTSAIDFTRPIPFELAPPPTKVVSTRS